MSDRAVSDRAMTATHGVNVFVVVVLSGGLLVSASETTTCVDPLGNAIGGTTGASYPDDCAGHNCSLSFWRGHRLLLECSYHSHGVTRD